MEPNQIFLIVLSGLIIAIPASILGVFVITRKMALTIDVLSHVALPGIGLALILNINPFIGALIFLWLALIALNFIKIQSRLPEDAIIGILFVLALAVGVFLVPNEHLLETLFGGISQINLYDLTLLVIGAVVILFVIWKFFREFTLTSISEEWAASQKIKVKIINLIFYLTLGLIVALGIKIIGTLLMGALVIIPAASAFNLAKSLRQMMGISAIIGIISSGTGLYLAQIFSLSPGPMVIFVSVLIFAISLMLKR